MPPKNGANLRGSDTEVRREAARQMGMARTPAKVAASVSNMAIINEKRKAEGVSETTRKRLAAAQQARRERERLQKEAQPVVATQLPLPGTLEDSDKPGRGASTRKPKQAEAGSVDLAALP